MQFELTKQFLEELESLIDNRKNSAVKDTIAPLHPADIAEIIDELNTEHASFVYRLLEDELAADVLVELEEDVRNDFLEKLSSQEIASSLEHMDSDDAADVVAELEDDIVDEVIDLIEDREHSQDIRNLLSYDETMAGSIMGTEYIKANLNWPVNRCVVNMRKQAEEVDRVYSIYVVDDNDVLVGTLSLKSLLFATPSTLIKDIYMDGIKSVTADTETEEVAKIIQKYDLVALPVVDDANKLIGRITVDDVMDFIQEEAEKDYQLASGISTDVEADDSIWQLSKARLPWLILGLIGGLCSVFIMEGFETAMVKYRQLFFFTPLIAAMAGNVGVQSSAIVVQSLATENIESDLWNRFSKELVLSIFNGIILGLLIMLSGYIFEFGLNLSITIAISMLAVIIVAALIGTFVPLILNKRGIDPALATGPFITTSNDIFGIFIFFYLAKVMLGF